METINLSARIKAGRELHKVTLSLIEFNEDNTFIIYSPALDLSGYGYTQEEAKESFNEALIEFVKYTSNKKTTDKILTSLGWIKKKYHNVSTFSPPKDSDLIKSNTQYSEIIDNKDYIKKSVELCF